MNWPCGRTRADDLRENPRPVDPSRHVHFHAHGGRIHAHEHAHTEPLAWHAHSARLDVPVRLDR